MNSFLYLYFKLERKTKRGKSLSDWPVVSPHLIPIRSAMAADDIFLPAVLNRASGLGFFVCLFCFVVVVFRRNHLLFRRANWFRTDSFGVIYVNISLTQVTRVRIAEARYEKGSVHSLRDCQSLGHPLELSR